MNQISDFIIKDKRVFIRADLNVPMQSGIISSENRIKASLPTIRYALRAGAKVMVTSHLGRPAEGHFTEKDSLAPVAEYLSKELSQYYDKFSDPKFNLWAGGSAKSNVSNPSFWKKAWGSKWKITI